MIASLALLAGLASGVTLSIVLVSLHDVKTFGKMLVNPAPHLVAIWGVVALATILVLAVRFS